MKYKKLISFVSSFLLITLFYGSVIAGPNQERVIPKENPETVPPPNVKQLPLVHNCGPSKQIVKMLFEKYGEVPLVLGKALVIDKNEKEVEGTLVIHVNTTTSTFTVNIMIKEYLCLLTSGEDFLALPGLMNRQPQEERQYQAPTEPQRPNGSITI